MPDCLHTAWFRFLAPPVSFRHTWRKVREEREGKRVTMALIAIAAPLLLLLLFIRVMYVLLSTGKPVRNLCPSKPVSMLIILGSGGHTAEMMNLLSVLEIDKFSPRSYIAASTDNMSLQKAKVFEQSFAHGASTVDTSNDANFMQIYRSREVGQSYVTSVGTTLIAMVHALWFILKIRPQVVLCNGPGTCIPLCVAAFFVKVVGIRWSFIFYVESIARVKKLSLSGLMLYKLHLADLFFVQWPKLQKAYPRSQYVGCLM